MKTLYRYRMSEYHSLSGTAHYIGDADGIEALPEFARPVVAADPEAEEWCVPIPDAPGLELVIQRRVTD